MRRLSSSKPTEQITACLKRIAQSMESDRPVQLWVTGHSLGGALASLVFARYMRVPEDLGPDIVLRDAYTYGGESPEL